MGNVKIIYAGGTTFSLVSSEGIHLETVGVFPGHPDGVPDDRLYIVRELESNGGSCKGRFVGTAITLNEAGWVSHGLAKKVASDIVRVSGGKVVDETSYSGKTNFYGPELERIINRNLVH